MLNKNSPSHTKITSQDLNSGLLNGLSVSSVGGGLSPLAAAEEGRVVAVADVVCPVCTGVDFDLRVAIAEVRETVAVVLELPVVEAGLADGLEVVQGAARPDDGDLAVLLVPRAAVLVPHGALHELVAVLGKLLDGLQLGVEAVDVLGLPPVHHFEDVVGLCLCKREIMGVRKDCGLE